MSSTNKVEPGWPTNQFVYVAGSQPKTYFVLIGSGETSNPKEGHTSPITGNDSNSLTVDTSGDSPSGITANTQVMVASLSIFRLHALPGPGGRGRRSEIRSRSN